MIRFAVGVKPCLTSVLVLRILGLYPLNELKRTNWDTFGNHQAKQGIEYIERYVSCGCFIVLLGNWNLIDAVRGVLVKATTLIPSHSVTLFPGRLRARSVVLKPGRKTRTRYYPKPLDYHNLTTMLTLGFSDSQIIGVCDILFNEDIITKVP
jgi:hypothetical protein